MRFDPVNLLNNIPMMMGLGAGNILKPQGAASQQGVPQGQQGLIGFLNLILQNMQGTSNAVPTPANIGDLAAKISQILRTNPADAAGIENLIQAFIPDAAPELTAKIAEVIQTAGTPAQALKPALVSDLAALLAQDIQQQPSVETQVADFLAEHADQMAAIAGKPGNNGLALGQTQDMALDQNILDALRAKFADLQIAHGGDINGAVSKEALLAFKADVIRFLQEQGFDTTTIRQYLAAFTKTMRESAPEQVLMDTPVTKALEKGDARHSSFWAAAEGEAAETLAPRASPQDGGGKPAPKNNLHPGAQNATPAPQQTQQTQPAQKAPAATSHLALINGMASDESAGGGTFGERGGNTFGHSHAFDGAGALRPAGEAGPQGFINYMHAARGQQSPTTQMVGIHIQRNIAAKVDTFTLQLDPAELGRLDVSLKFDRDGGVKAHLTVERPETLALLQRDAGHLERLLAQSGLDVDGGALSFDLREQGRQAEEREAQNDGGGDFANEIDGTEGARPQTARIAVETYGYVTQNSVNIMV